MKWPWRREGGHSAAVIGGTADAVYWLRGEAAIGQGGTLRDGGVLERGSDTPQEFARRLRALALPAKTTLAVLPLDASHLLQIEAPKVPADELRAAARWHVKDLVHERLEDLTLDVMPVGDGRDHGTPHLFVAAARSDEIRQRVALAAAAGLELTVVDIVETAQRNLQCALAAAEGLEGRATAALTRHGTQALLTICAAGELFYARRLDNLGLQTSDGSGLRPTVAADVGEIETPAFVDYSAEPAPDADLDAGLDAGFGHGLDAGAPRLVIELQRSIDVWERTWRDLPLARLWVQLGEDTARWLPGLQAALGLTVDELRPGRLFPGFEQAAASPELREALLPLAGALLRSENRSL
jgi:MSHA biogenesis protein MshI